MYTKNPFLYTQVDLCFFLYTQGGTGQVGQVGQSGQQVGQQVGQSGQVGQVGQSGQQVGQQVGQSGQQVGQSGKVLT